METGGEGEDVVPCAAETEEETVRSGKPYTGIYTSPRGVVTGFGRALATLRKACLLTGPPTKMGVFLEAGHLYGPPQLIDFRRPL